MIMDNHKDFVAVKWESTEQTALNGLWQWRPAMPRVTFLCLYMIPLDQEQSTLYWTMPKLMLFLSKIKKLKK
ncbi:hypothetical protein Hanom_Chr00s121701g01811901 [Helianthus anomalus]